MVKSIIQILLISWFFISFSCEDNSQKQEFNYFTYGGEGDQIGYSIIQDQNDDYVITGVNENYGVHKLLLMKLDQLNSIIWSKSIGEGKNYSSFNLVETSDNDFIIIGNEYDNDSSDIIVKKIDYNGEISWSKKYGNNYDGGRDLKINNDGDLIFLGNSTTQGLCCYDILVIKTDSQGNKVWENSYDFNGLDDYGNSIQVTDDGGYIIGGSTSFDQFTEHNLLLFKIDSLGNIVWENHDFGYLGEIISIEKNLDGSFILLGNVEINGWVQRSVLLSKIGSDGQIIWSKVIDNEKPILIGEDLDITSDNGIVFTGVSWSGNDPNEITEMSVIKTDGLGNVLWKTNINDDDSLWGKSIIENNEGEFVIVGKRWTESYYNDIIIVSVDNDGIILE